MTTFADQVAIALDNASAYQQIEKLNVGLEAKVRETDQGARAGGPPPILIPLPCVA